LPGIKGPFGEGVRGEKLSEGALSLRVTSLLWTSRRFRVDVEIKIGVRVAFLVRGGGRKREEAAERGYLNSGNQKETKNIRCDAQEATRASKVFQSLGRVCKIRSSRNSILCSRCRNLRKEA